MRVDTQGLDVDEQPCPQPWEPLLATHYNAKGRARIRCVMRVLVAHGDVL